MEDLVEGSSIQIRLVDLWCDGLEPSGVTPPILYHYTDFRGLKGILERNVLWATYVRSLNDSTEGIYGETVIRDALKELCGHEFHDAIDDGMDSGADKKPLFATCFCTYPDVLSMWRAYSDRGGGYCLGFDYASLFAFRPKPKREFVIPIQPLVQVLYGKWRDELFEFVKSLAKL